MSHSCKTKDHFEHLKPFLYKGIYVVCMRVEMFYFKINSLANNQWKTLKDHNIFMMKSANQIQ